jgi:hypothetical protein
VLNDRTIQIAKDQEGGIMRDEEVIARAHIYNDAIQAKLEIANLQIARAKLSSEVVRLQRDRDILRVDIEYLDHLIKDNVGLLFNILTALGDAPKKEQPEEKQAPPPPIGILERSRVLRHGNKDKKKKKKV